MNPSGDKMDKVVDSDAVSLKSLFSEKYKVDFYQREYVWQQKQLEDLINDLSNEFLRSYNSGDDPEKVQQYDPYYMGEIVVSKHGSENSVIDGQQRITTFTLLLMWIKNRFKDIDNLPDISPLIYSDSFGKKRFNLDVPEREECMLALNNSEDYSPEDDAPASVQNLLNRYNDISDCWNSEIDDEKIVNFVYWLEEKVMFSKVWTNSDDFAYVIFETMNDRGLSLTQVEMLRSYLLANIDRGDKRDRAMKKYDGIVKELVSVNLGSKSKAEFEFFKIFLRSHYANGSMSAKSGDTDFVRIGKQFHRWVKDNSPRIGLNTPDDYPDFIDRLKFFSDVYVKIHRYIERRDTDNHLYLVVNNDFNFTLQPALILAAIKYGDSEELIEEKISIVSRYLTKVLTWRVWGHWVISQSSMEGPIYDLCSKVRDIETTDELHAILDEEPLTMPSIDEGIPILNHQNITKLKVVLSLITEIVARNSVGSNYLLNNKEPIEVEHIWANHYDQHTDEFSSEQDFSNVRNSIGDLLVLPKGVNASYNDAPYSVKVEHYHKENILAASLNKMAYEPQAGFSGFRDFINRTGLQFKPYEAFSKNSIEQRANLYRSILKWNWNI